jgi:hypothetical protein
VDEKKESIERTPGDIERTPGEKERAHRDDGRSFKGRFSSRPFKIGIGDDEYKRLFIFSRASLSLRLDLENVTTNLYNEFLPSDPLKLGWMKKNASAKHPKLKTGVEYSLVGQEINIPGINIPSAEVKKTTRGTSSPMPSWCAMKAICREDATVPKDL